MCVSVILNHDAIDVLEKFVHGLPDDLFEDLMEMMVPPGDFARRDEVLAKQTKRTK